MNRWPTKRLDEVAEIVMGQAPPGDECNCDGNGTPFVKAGEFGESRPIIREWTTKPLKMARSSDVLVCVVGATCGKLNLGADCAIGRSVAALRPNSELLNQKLLYGFLMGWTQRLRSGSQGSAQGVLTRDMLSSIPIPVPPLPEQERIVRLLDEADALRQLRAQADQRTAALIPALFQHMFEDVAATCRAWPKKPLGELTTRITKGESPGWQGFQYTEEGPIFITSENVLWGNIDLRQPKRIPSAFHEKLARSTIRPQDVLLNLVGASIGRCCLAPSGLGEANINQAVAVISCGERLLPDFLTHLLLSRNAQSYFHGGKVEAARANISLSDIRRYVTVVPPLPLQQRFADRVRKIRLMEAEQARSATRLTDLFQSLLHEFFT